MDGSILFVLGGIVVVVFIINMIKMNGEILTLKRDLNEQLRDSWAIIYFLREVLPNEKWLPAAKKEVLKDIKKDLFGLRHGLTDPAVGSFSTEGARENARKRILANISKFDEHLIGFLQVGKIRDGILQEELARKEEILGLGRGDKSEITGVTLFSDGNFPEPPRKVNAADDTHD